MLKKLRELLRAWSGRAETAWLRRSLSSQFAFAAFFVLGCGMVMLGLWVSKRIEKGVVQNAANIAALYINSFVEPHTQKLLQQRTFDPEDTQAIDFLLKETPLGRKVRNIKIWLPDGTLAYSNHHEAMGRRYRLTERLQKALAGTVSAALETDEDDEYRPERTPTSPLIEIYSPLMAGSPPRVYAVAEFYQLADDLQAELRGAQRQTLYVVALVTLAMFSVLFVIVRRGSRTIETQEARLRGKIVQLSDALSENQLLSRRVDEAHHRLLATNDLILRRLGSELHDGPAQLISLALLRLDGLRPDTGARNGPLPANEDFDRVRGALTDALQEIRGISAGVGLPQLENITAEAALRLVARNHERRTGTDVTIETETALPRDLPLPVKACLYRIAQEGLNNAFRHAAGQGQRVRSRLHNGIVELEVSDCGPGLPSGPDGGSTGKLGLIGMRDRVASLGGTFEIHSRPGEGTRLVARFDTAKLKKAGTGAVAT